MQRYLSYELRENYFPTNLFRVFIPEIVFITLEKHTVGSWSVYHNSKVYIVEKLSIMRCIGSGLRPVSEDIGLLDTIRYEQNSADIVIQLVCVQLVHAI